MSGPRSADDAVRPNQCLVVVHPDLDSLSIAAAALFVREARRSVKVTGRFSVALSGGSTPKRTYQLLARPPFVDLVPWDRTHVFWTDERCVAARDPRSNELMARGTLLDHVPIPPDQIHPMGCAAGGEREARRSAGQYESLLRAFFPSGEGAATLDLVLLGLGADSHAASLFPGSPALREQEHWVAPVFVDAAASAGTTASGQGLWRITLTAPFVNRAASVVFLVSGTAKASAAKEVLQGALDTMRLPAQLIRPQNGTLHWYLDDDSAALLVPASERS